MSLSIRIRFFAVWTALLFSASTFAQTVTPVAANGQLKVVNRQLSNESGKAIQLRGMSSHGLQWFDQCYTHGSVQTLATDWGIDVFRAAMYVDEGGYLNNQAGLRAKIDQLVDWTGQNGVYCIIDWHVLNPGNPNDRLSYAIDFFRTMAQKHAGKKHVIYEICNEPNGVDWNTVKNYAEQVIPVIRQYDSQAIILVGTPTWSGTPGDVRANPLTGANAYNIMYTFHFYAGSHYSQSYIDDVLKTVPLFISEWGTSNYSGDGGNDYTNAQNWMNLLAGGNSSGIKVSWCNWSFADKSESSAALNAGACNNAAWNNTSTSGTWVKNHILSPADDFGPPAPAIAITSPASNTAVLIGSTVTISATVSNTTANTVEFYTGATKLGEDTTAPYTWTISNIAAGTYSFTAKAILPSGGPLVSSTVSVTAAPPPNQVPTVTLTLPANNAQYTQPTSLTLTATASDSDGSVTKVEFYNGSTKLGEDATAPYTYAWANVPAGTYTLTAKAIDNQSSVGTSASVAITVIDPNAPVGDIIGPDCVVANTVKTYSLNSANLPNATSFSWWCTGSTQTMTPSGGSVSINFGPSFTGGQVCIGVNYSAAPWYKQFCKTVTICTGQPTNQAPTVSLTAPANNAQFTAPASITLTANASDSDGSVTKVEFFTGSTKLGESTTSPYRYVWSSVGTGTYVLTAKATDNSSAVMTSSQVNISVTNPMPVNQAPTVSLSGPANGATFTAPASVSIMANATDTDGTIAKVEFFNGATKLGESTTSPYRYVWSNISAGTYTLTAKATDNLGATTTSGQVTITVNNPPNQAPTVALTSPANNATFTAPATINLAATASDQDGSVAKVEFYNGSTKLGEATGTYTFSWANVAAGTYTLTAKAIDNLGVSTTSTAVSITVKTSTATPNPTADVIGPDCVRPNDVKVYELNATNLPNATNFSWWCTGSTRTITVASGKATIDFGPWFTGGQVCVGVNYSAAPWYKQYCKTLTVCPSNARLIAEPAAGVTVVYPNPTTVSFSFVADADAQAVRVIDMLGRERQNLGAVRRGQTITFGEELPAGHFLLNIQYDEARQRSVKLLKEGE